MPADERSEVETLEKIIGLLEAAIEECRQHLAEAKEAESENRTVANEN